MCERETNDVSDFIPRIMLSVGENEKIKKRRMKNENSNRTIDNYKI